MAGTRIAHREIIDNLQKINTFGQQRAAAALLSGDLDHNLRVDPSELPGVMRAIAVDRQLNQPSRDAVINAVQGAFTRLASPKTCEHGVPHQKLVASLEKLNTFGKQRAAAALSSSDIDADLCVTQSELPGAVRAVSVDRQLNQPSRKAVGNNLQLGFVRLQPPKSGVGGVGAR